MKVAILLSGSLREPHKALHSLDKFAGHDLDVFIHTWKNVGDIVQDSWSHRQQVEPSDAVLSPYNAKAMMVEDWGWKKPIFAAMVERWEQEYGLKNWTNLGVLGMYWSIWQAALLVPKLSDYDLLVRLRFDCDLIDNPLDYKETGWIIPEGQDYGGVNDQLAWYWTEGWRGRYNNHVNCFLKLFPDIETMMMFGVPYHPETLLKHQITSLGIDVKRPVFRYTIH